MSYFLIEIITNIKLSDTTFYSSISDIYEFVNFSKIQITNTKNISSEVLSALNLELCSLDLSQLLSTFHSNNKGSICYSQLQGASNSNFNYGNQIKSFYHAKALLLNHLQTGTSAPYTWNLPTHGFNDTTYWTNVIYNCYIMFHRYIELLFALVGWMCTILGRSRALSILLFLFGRFTLVNATQVGISPERLRIILTTLCWPIYIGLSCVLDHKYRLFIAKHKGLFAPKEYTRDFFIQRINISVLFLLAINSGVLFSTGFWYSVSFDTSLGNGLFAGFSFAISYFACVAWIRLARLSFDSRYIQYLWLISFARASVESIAFNFISWYSFYLWTYWSRLDGSNVFAILLGTFLFFIFGPFQVYLEERLIRVWIYGIIYQLSFAMLSFTTSGWFFLYELHRTSYSDIIMFVGSTILILVFPMELYRDIIMTDDIVLGVDESTSLYGRIFGAALRYYLAFLWFVIQTTLYIPFITWLN